MHTDLSAFSPSVQDELSLLTRSLVDQYERTARACASRKQKRSRIRSVILHGERDAGDRDITPSRYHLLVVVNRLLPAFVWPVEMAEVYLGGLEGVSVPVSLTFETQETVNAKLRDGYALYHRIAEHGVVLYEAGDRGLDLLSVPDSPSPEVHHAKAKDFFERDWELTCSFLGGAYRYQLDDQRSSSALMLHLAAEQAYMAFMRVHTLQRPYVRTLADLAELCESIHGELKLPWSGPGGSKAFHYLGNAFLGARFSDHYMMEDSLLDQMRGRTEDLLRMVRYLCRLKLETLKSGSLSKPDKDWLEITTSFQEEVLPARPLTQEEGGTQEIKQDTLQHFFHAVWDLEDPACDALRAVDVLHFVHMEDTEPDRDRLYLMINVCKERVTHLNNCIYGLFGKMKDLTRDKAAPAISSPPKGAGEDEPEETSEDAASCTKDVSKATDASTEAGNPATPTPAKSPEPGPDQDTEDPPSIMDMEEPCFNLIAAGELLYSLAHGGLPIEPEPLNLIAGIVSDNGYTLKGIFNALHKERKKSKKTSRRLPPEEAFPACSSRVA